MTCRSILGIFAVAASLAVSPAQANSLGSRSSGTVSITFTIPPFREGLAARAEGAAGLWTMVDNQSTLMVKLPDSVSGGGGEVEAAIFTHSSAPFNVSMAETALTISPRAVRTGNGLNRYGFAVRSAAAGSAGAPRTATMIVAGI